MGKRRRVSGFLLALVAFFSGLSALSSSAGATDGDCSPASGHCYLRSDFQTDTSHTMRGEAMDIEYVYLQVSGLTTQPTAFVTAEGWVNTNDTLGGVSWVEAGLADGYPVETGDQYFYWADQRPTHAYAEHDDFTDTPVPGTYYHQDIHMTSSNTWSVQIASWTGTSTDNPGPSIFLQAGMETNVNNISNIYVQEHNTQLKFYNGSGTLSNNWEYTVRTCGADPVPADFTTIVIASGCKDQYSAHYG